jgi:hypothetical protein
MRIVDHILLLGVFLAMSWLPLESAGVTVLKFVIDDDFPGNPAFDPGAFSDGVPEYADYRVYSDSFNYCVQAEPYPPGNLFVRLNRNLDGDSGTQRCSDNGGTPRQFVLQIHNATACGYLASAYNTADPGDEDGVFDLAGNSYGGTGPCRVPRNDNPRIRFETLYKSKAKQTTVDFLTIMRGKPVSYEIRSDTAAPIKHLDAVTREVAYTGTYHLVEFRPGTRAKTVGPAFPMPVRMVFTQVVVQ